MIDAPHLDQSGLNAFLKEISELDREITNSRILDAIEVGTDTFVNDLRALPRPKSRISAGGYTHMVDSFTSERSGLGVRVGWGKYYGRFVEYGTRKMDAQPHLIPTYNRNQEKYVQMIRMDLFGY